MRRSVGLCAAIWFVLVAVPAAVAQSADPLMKAAAERYMALVQETSRTVAPPAYMPGDGPAEQGSRLIPVDLRLALLKLARPEDTRGRKIVLAAQGSRGPIALSLAAGRMTLPQVMAEAGRLDPAFAGPDGLAVPLIVEQGAALDLTEGAILALDTAAGALVINFGHLDIAGGGIVAAGPANPAEPSFTPFVVTAGQGVMTAQDAYFAGLGFGAEPAFAGLSVLVSGFYQNDLPSTLTGSILRQVGSTVFAGGAGVEIRDNRFLDPRRTALILRATTAARVYRNVFLDGSAGDAIRVAPLAKGTEIVANEIFGPRESGIALLPDSFDTVIRDVTIWRPRHHGVMAEGSDCLAMSDVRILGPRQNGIVLHASHRAELTGNAVVGSKRAGLLVSDLAEGSVTRLTGNRFVLNKAGIETSAPGALHLSRNDFSDQFPRFLVGDVQFMTPELLRDLTGTSHLVLAAGGLPDAAPAAPACPTDRGS